MDTVRLIKNKRKPRRNCILRFEGCRRELGKFRTLTDVLNKKTLNTGFKILSSDSVGPGGLMEALFFTHRSSHIVTKAWAY